MSKDKIIQRFRHTGIVVNDMKKALWFYHDILNFEIVMERYESSDYFKKVNGINNEAMTVKVAVGDGTVIELIQYKNSGDWITPGHTTIGKMHQCYLVSDARNLYDELKQKGMKFISEPVQSDIDPAIVCSCYDPKGNYIEFVEIIGDMPEGLQ
jgi:catechol 2,3-dioxygenase-like lactoylglutathione lyase family enzyme